MVRCIECGIEPKLDISTGEYICKCYPDYPVVDEWIKENEIDRSWKQKQEEV